MLCAEYMVHQTLCMNGPSVCLHVCPTLYNVNQAMLLLFIPIVPLLGFCAHTQCSTQLFWTRLPLRRSVTLKHLNFTFCERKKKERKGSPADHEHLQITYDTQIIPHFNQKSMNKQNQTNRHYPSHSISADSQLAPSVI